MDRAWKVERRLLWSSFYGVSATNNQPYQAISVSPLNVNCECPRLSFFLFFLPSSFDLRSKNYFARSSERHVQSTGRKGTCAVDHFVWICVCVCMFVCLCVCVCWGSVFFSWSVTLSNCAYSVRIVEKKDRRNPGLRCLFHLVAAVTFRWNCAGWAM